MTDIKRIHQEKGPDLSYTSANILEEDGLFFKDLARTGVLLPYEDYRLSHKERARDLAKRLSDEEIIGVNIPTAVPLVYEFDDDFNVIKHSYLGDQEALAKKMQAVANQGKKQ